MKLDTEKDIWSRLASQKEKKIVMYGMGNGADKILRVCDKRGIPVSDFFASDGFVRGQLFHGKHVMSFSEIKEKYGADNIIVLVAFATSLPEVEQAIERVAAECELYVPDVPVFGEEVFDSEFCAKHADELREVYGLWADEASREVYESIIKYRLGATLGELQRVVTDKSVIYSDLLCTDRIVTAVDAGAYNGDTVRELADVAPRLSDVFALEPDARNFAKLSEYAASETRFKVIPVQSAAWSEACELPYDASGNRNACVGTGGKRTRTVSAVTIDSLCTNRCDYIKYDVEGSEREALLGSARTIEDHRPSLLVSGYHHARDIFSLPLLIHSLCPSYKLYLRRCRCIPAWDINIIAHMEK